MHMLCCVFVLCIVTCASACCYTLQRDHTANKVPIYTWYLDTLSQHPVRPTDCVGELHAVDRRNGPVLSACELMSIDYRPMDSPQIGWTRANLTEAERVIFTQPCIGFGPYRAGDRPSSLLLHTFSDAWIRLQLSCDDSLYASCVHFGLRMRQAAESRLVTEEMTDPYLDSCVRTASPTPSVTPTPSATPTPSQRPTPTSLPGYNSAFRIEATFDSEIFVAIQVGLSYEKLRETSGRSGAFWCSTPVLDAKRTHVMTTLYIDEQTDTQRKRGSHTIAEWAAQMETQTQPIQATVLWSAGGFCRVTITVDHELTFGGCRLFIGPKVYETVSWSQVIPLDPRSIPLCGVVVTAAEPEPSQPPAPVECSADRSYRLDTEKSLVVMQSQSVYAEAQIRWIGCSDGSEEPRFHQVARVFLDGSTSDKACSIDESKTQVHCGDDLLVAVAGSGCDSIESSLPLLVACGPQRDAVLLIN